MLSKVEILALRKTMRMDQAEFGRQFGMGSAAVGHWENGRTKPPSATMAQLVNLYQRHFPADRISEGGSDYESRSLAGMTVRQIADIIYKRLPREARLRVDGEYAAAVMQELAKQELTKGDDDES
jgi:transcriptional regulator with XRE-family HTH domain